MTTENQIEANKENAKKSTGPNDTSDVKFNALTHGILSKSVVIEKGEGKEDVEEFKFILQSLREDIKPENILEEIAVEKIAVNYWRLRRIVNAEKGYLRIELDNLSKKLEDDVLRLMYSKRGTVEDEIEQERLKNQIPPIAFTDVISRYETSIERSIIRNLELIEKLRKNKLALFRKNA